MSGLVRADSHSFCPPPPQQPFQPADRPLTLSGRDLGDLGIFCRYVRELPFPAVVACLLLLLLLLLLRRWLGELDRGHVSVGNLVVLGSHFGRLPPVDGVVESCSCRGLSSFLLTC